MSKIYSPFIKAGLLPKIVEKSADKNPGYQLLSLEIDVDTIILQPIVDELEKSVVEVLESEANDAENTDPLDADWEDQLNTEYNLILEEGKEETLSKSDSEQGDIFASYKGRRDKF